jgi:N-acetylneuraminic acid mutarotase
MKEETISIEEYEYLPCNIINCSFIACAGELYAFGGISRNSKKKVHYNLNVYHFNRNKLAWSEVAQLDSARVKPSLVLSETGKQIYVMSGELDTGNECLETFVFDTLTKKVEKFVDMGLMNPFKKLTEKHTFKVFQLS